MSGKYIVAVFELAEENVSDYTTMFALRAGSSDVPVEFVPLSDEVDKIWHDLRRNPKLDGGLMAPCRCENGNRDLTPYAGVLATLLAKRSDYASISVMLTWPALELSGSFLGQGISVFHVEGPQYVVKRLQQQTAVPDRLQ